MILIILRSRQMEIFIILFRGNDIDYIEIKTDDGDIQTGGAEKRRSYNYRLTSSNLKKVLLNRKF